jgi:hypothetical protein
MKNQSLHIFDNVAFITPLSASWVEFLPELQGIRETLEGHAFIRC